MKKINEQVITTLLDDDDPMSVIEAMRLALDQTDDPMRFIAAHQDDSSPLIRRHVQQLSVILNQQMEYQAFLRGFKSKRLSFWDGIFMISIMSEGRTNRDHLHQQFDIFADGILESARSGVPMKTSELIQAVKESPLHVPRGLDYFHVYNLFLTDIMDTGNCHPVVLCEIVRQLGIRVGWYAAIVMYDGMYMLKTAEGTVISPDNDWNVVQKATENQYHVCSNDELLKVYLGLMHMMSIVSRRPIGVYGSARILADMLHLNRQDMLYPIGSKKLRPGKILSPAP